MNVKTGDLISFEAFPEITREQLRAYASASGDPNPIHLEDEVARKAGLPGVVAHGMLSAAYVAERAIRFVHREATAPEARIVNLSTRFRAMAFPGDVISVGGSVKLSEPGKLVLLLQAKTSKGEVTLTGEALFKLPPLIGAGERNSLARKGPGVAQSQNSSLLPLESMPAEQQPRRG